MINTPKKYNINIYILFINILLFIIYFKGLDSYAVISKVISPTGKQGLFTFST